jgi:hypothetical protein
MLTGEQAELVYLLLDLLAVFALIGIYLRYRQRLGFIGLAASAVALSGAASIVGPDGMLFGASLYMVGSVLGWPPTGGGWDRRRRPPGGDPQRYPGERGGNELLGSVEVRSDDTTPSQRMSRGFDNHQPLAAVLKGLPCTGDEGQGVRADAHSRLPAR